MQKNPFFSKIHSFSKPVPLPPARKSWRKLQRTCRRRANALYLKQKHSLILSLVYECIGSVAEASSTKNDGRNPWRTSLLETKPPAPLASFLAAAHARIIAAEGSAALSRGSRGPRERAKVLLSPPIYPLLLHALHHSSVSASSPLSPRETHHKSYTSRIKHTGTRAPGTPSFAMGGEKKFIFENRSFFRSL